MIEISLTLKALSPLALHQNRATAQFAPTLDYIPGSTLRGALAGLYLQGDASRAKAADFDALFLNDQVFYPDLLPATNPGEPWHLIPATAWACKRFGVIGKDSHRASVTDTLLRLELAETLRRQGRQDWQAPVKDIEGCPICETDYPVLPENRPRDRQPETRPRDRLDQTRYAMDLEPSFLAIKVRRRLRTGTAVDRATGAVASGMLFSQQVMGNSLQFTGWLRLVDDQAAKLEALLKKLAPTDTHLYLGYGRSRGLGHVQVTYWGKAGPPASSLSQRWEQFNQAVQKLWQRHGADVPPDRYFSLTLASHLALHDEGGQPILGEIQPGDLGLPGATWGWRDLSAVAVPGWNAAWGLPKPDTWALQRGSVLLARVPPAQEAATLARLNELESEGVGDRRAEGFGRLLSCDEFHYIYTLQELRR